MGLSQFAGNAFDVFGVSQLILCEFISVSNTFHTSLCNYIDLCSFNFEAISK